jgi:hypothetical protein
MIFDHVVRKSKTRKFERLWIYRPGKQEIYFIVMAEFGERAKLLYPPDPE